MILCGKTDIGKRRQNNQDCFATRTFDMKNEDGVSALALVCDGMGGVNGGNIASRLACDAFTAYTEKFFKTVGAKDGAAVSEGEYISMLAHAVATANRVVYNRANAEPELFGMGTTLVAALTVGDALYTVNVGDSRMYLCRENGMKQLTKDHSLVQFLIDKGKITKEEARTYPNRNVITRAVGIEPTIDADICFVDIGNMKKNDRLLLCSDGLSGYVSEETIAAVLASHTEDAVAALDALIDAANSAGGHDNVTAVLLCPDFAERNIINEGDAHGDL